MWEHLTQSHTRHQSSESSVFRHSRKLLQVHWHITVCNNESALCHVVSTVYRSLSRVVVRVHLLRIKGLWITGSADHLLHTPHQRGDRAVQRLESPDTLLLHPEDPPLLNPSLALVEWMYLITRIHSIFTSTSEMCVTYCTTDIVVLTYTELVVFAKIPWYVHALCFQMLQWAS